MTIAQDKKDHFTAGFLIAVTVGYFFNPIWGALAAFVAGWVKEKLDKRFPAEHTYDPKDAKFTMWGGVLGAIFIKVIML